MADKSQKEDKVLVKVALTNSDNYSDLVHKYEKPIISYIIKISGVIYEEAEDIAQEIFLKAYTNLNDFDVNKKFSSWLFAIAHNETISYWRKHKKRLQIINLEDQDLDKIIADELNITKKIDDKILKQEIKQALAEIDFKYREVIQLRYINEYSYDEISDIIKKPINSVGTLINRAKKKLRAVLINKKYD